MDDKQFKDVNKEVDKTIKRAAEEVRGRELTPSTVEVRVVVRTKEGENVVHHSGQVDISPSTKK